MGTKLFPYGLRRKAGGKCFGVVIDSALEGKTAVDGAAELDGGCSLERMDEQEIEASFEMPRRHRGREGKSHWLAMQHSRRNRGSLQYRAGARKKRRLTSELGEKMIVEMGGIACIGEFFDQ